MLALFNALNSLASHRRNSRGEGRRAESSSSPCVRRVSRSLRPRAEALDDRTLLSPAPLFTVTPISGTQIQLSWNPVNCQGYYVDEWETINGKGTWVTLANPNTLPQGPLPQFGPDTYTISGLKPNTTYYFDVASYSSGITNWAPYQSATTYPASYPVFTLHAGPNTGTQVSVSWQPVAGATGYLVQELEYLHFGKITVPYWATIASLSGKSTNYTVNGLTLNTTYSFRVASEGAWGTTYANPQSVTTYFLT
jgi:hypothetical protein